MLKLIRINDSVFRANTISVKGKTGFGINVIDKQDFANNKNGVHKISTYLNEKLINSINFDGFLFEESILINTFIDYQYYINNKERILKLFKTSGNKLSFYKNSNDGLIDEIKTNSEFKIKVSDIKKNNIYILININNQKNIT